MNKEQNYLIILQEELTELSVELLTMANHVSKAVRFGIDEKRDLPTSNRERIEAEWNDLLGSIQKLRKVGIDLKPDLEAIEAKMSKIDRYTKYSKSLGTCSE